MYQHIIPTAQAQTFRLPIPGGTPEGAFQVVMFNNSIALGPTTYLLRLAPGAHIPAHFHKQATENFVFLEGDFTDDGTDYTPGTYFSCQPNTVHGPYSTQSGATLLVMQSTEVGGADFIIANPAAA